MKRILATYGSVVPRVGFICPCPFYSQALRKATFKV